MGFKTIKNISRDYTPLQLSMSIAISGNVPAIQTYDAGTQIYEPDYVTVPLILEPQIGAIDPDGVYAATNLTELVFNGKWHQIENGVKTEIVSSPLNSGEEGCEILSEAANGHPKGTLIIHKNIQPSVPITFVYTAKLEDPRIGCDEVYDIEASFKVECETSNTMPSLLVDAPAVTCFNPLRDFNPSNPASLVQEVHAKLMIGAQEAEAENTIMVWEVLRSYNSGTRVAIWTEIDEDCDEYMDFELSLSSDKRTLTIRKDMIGDKLTLRVRAAYDPYGAPELNERSLCKVFSFSRKMIVVDAEIGGIPTSIPPDLNSVSCTAYISDRKGLLTNPGRELEIKWHAAKNNTAHSNSYQAIGLGESTSFNPQSLMHESRGVNLELDIEDRGPWGLMVDGDGKYIVDGDGKLLLIR